MTDSESKRAGPRVFVVQRPSYRERGAWVDKYDLTPAEHFGRLVELLPRGNVPRQLEVTQTAIRAGFARERFSSSDYLLTVGDPVAIAAAAVVAAQFVEAEERAFLQLLKWDKKHQQYTCFRLENWA